MIQKWTRYRILEQFFDDPRKQFLIREISRNKKIAQTSVRLHLKALIDDRLITKKNEGLYPSFMAVRENPLFKLLKTQNLILRLHQSGILESIEKAAYPSCIVLFGSASQGEDTETSDIDLFIQSKHVNVNFKKAEKLLNRKMSLLFEQNIKTLAPELLNNMINGIVLKGYLKVL